MILAVYHIKSDKIHADVKVLYDKCLKRDRSWYYLPTEDGFFIRCEPGSAKALKPALKEMKADWSKVAKFSPSQDEYQYVCFFGDDLTALFHALSLVTLKYPANIVLKSIMERVFHIACIQCDVEWEEEAKILSELAMGRMKLYGKFYYKAS